MDAKTHRPDALEPIDLAREPDFALGPSRVSPSTREVLRGAERELLEPRLMQVLVALFQAKGRVVSRDELIARCWDGRIVGEDAINRAISRLRHLSEVDRQASFQLETIPRVGYRLLPAAPAAPAESLAPSTPKTTAPVRRNPVMRHRLAIAAAVAIIVAAATTWLLWPERKWTVENSRPFLSSLALESDPAFSPDGTTLAYNFGSYGSRKIYIRNLAGNGIRISSDDFDDTSPAWSSDGGHLAYVGNKAGEPCHLMVATVPAGEAHEVGRCRRADYGYSSVAWQPGTNFLYYIEHALVTGDSIIRLDLDNGTQVPVVTMPPVNTMILNLRCSPDGKWLAYLLMDNIVIRDLANGKERKLAPLERRIDSQTEMVWTPDSRALLATLSTGTGSRVSALPIDGGPPYPVYTTATQIGTLAASKDMLAMVSVIIRTNFGRLVATPEAPLDVVDAANGTSTSPSFAPDGTLAFASNRSGTNALWIKKPGGAPTQVFDSGSAPLFPVQFSPDGSRLVVAAEFMNTTAIRILTPDGATVKSFTVPPPGIPTWTADGKAILVFDRRDKRVWRVDVNDPDKRSPAAPPYWSWVTVRPEGTFAVPVGGQPGIWRIDGTPRLLTGKYPAFYYASPVFRGGDVLVPDFTGPIPRLLAQPLSGGADRLLGYMPSAENRRFRKTGFAVDPKTGDILYTANVSYDTNIDLLSLAKR